MLQTAALTGTSLAMLSTEPCARCPWYKERCVHYDGRYVNMSHSIEGGEDYFYVGGDDSPPWVVLRTRAEADAEFDRREEALLT